MILSVHHLRKSARWWTVKEKNMAIQKSTAANSLAEVIAHILDKGIVVDAGRAGHPRLP